MKKLLLITSAALVGFVSQAAATLTVMDTPSTDLALELRDMNKTDWATALAGNMFTAGGVTFTKDNTIDDGPVMITPDMKLIIESIYTHAGFVNDFGVVMSDGLDTFVTSIDTDQSVKVTTDTGDTEILGFEADVLGSDPAKSAGIVPSLNNDNVWTYAGGSSSKTHLLWLFEDYAEGAIGRDNDFNDFIVLGTISAVPEPSTIISLIAVGFLGFVTWRNRRKAKA